MGSMMRDGRSTGPVARLMQMASPLLAAAAIAAWPGGMLAAQPATESPASEWSRQVWSAARGGNGDEFLATLTRASSIFASESGVPVTDTAELLRANIEKRESSRSEQIEKLSAKIDESLAAEQGDGKVSEALRSAVELSMLAVDKSALMAEPRMVDLVARATKAARDAESRGDWLIANEIYYRLNLLFDDDKRFQPDLDRQSARLAMIRLYAPERFWTLRNDRRIAEGLSPLPPYNPTADGWQVKTEGISWPMVAGAIQRGAERYVERHRAGMKEMLIGGLDGVRTLVELGDVRGVFTGLADDAKRAEFLQYLTLQSNAVAEATVRLSREDLDKTIGAILKFNRSTVAIPDAALLHEFGNGAMARLDPFSAIIWPDEVKTFQRQTQGRFVGVGIQIQLDEQQNIKITTPLDGTPAQRAGIRSGDLIKKVDGVSTAGFSLDQAVSVITGAPGKSVTLTIERKAGDEFKSLDISIVRANIDVKTVKGWARTGAGERDWDYFIDRGHGIGYVRLTQFTESTTRDFDAAIKTMREQGLNALILDLRYNPGGLLDQAVSVASRFIAQGVIVRTETAGEVMVDQQSAQPTRSRINDVPVIVLINEGSASASEIVSGAVQDYAREGKIDALVVGRRSYGKGSVQNVWQITPEAAMKLTTQYYRLPAGRLIDKNRHLVTDWGVMPDLVVDRLPNHEAEAYEIRQAADIAEMDEQGKLVHQEGGRPDPNRLITEGLDLQLQTALAILQSRTTATRLVGTGGAAGQQ